VIKPLKSTGYSIGGGNMSKTTPENPSIFKGSLSEKNSVTLLETHQKNLKKQPASKLIRENLTPRNLYLRRSPHKKSKTEQSETYVRSGKHSRNAPLFPENEENKNILASGGHAHIGNSKNTLQTLGDKLGKSKKITTTSPGDAELYNEILAYKNNICAYITSHLNLCSHIKVGSYNDYPCLMIHIKKGKYTTSLTKAAFEAWVNLLISYYVGLVNYSAYTEKLPIELERRSSFGFLTPTIAPTGESIRISIGLIPKAYADLLIKNLKSLDQTLEKINAPDFNPPNIDNNTFLKTEAYKKYMGKKTVPTPKNILGLIFEKIEKGGKTGVQNIVRTPYARDGISAEIFKALLLKKEPINAFMKGISWATEKIEVKIKIEKKVQKEYLSFKQEGDISYGTKFTIDSPALNDDDDFFNLINLIIDKISKKENSIFDSVINDLSLCSHNKKIDDLYFKLELLNELIFIDSFHSEPDNNVRSDSDRDKNDTNCSESEDENNDNYDDGFGSDSDEEEDFDEKKLFSKKIIVQNGMRAILSATKAAVDYLSKANGNKGTSIFLDESIYYETELGIKLIEKLKNIKNIAIQKAPLESSILIHDLNACVTTGKENENYCINQNVFLILDGTSVSENCVQENLKRFLKSESLAVFLVDSGFKNQQFGGDKNPYGTVRIFTKDKKLREELYAAIKRDELPILSNISHNYRRTLKLFGMVPVTKTLLPKTENNEIENMTRNLTDLKI
jgi:hypothetical protein